MLLLVCLGVFWGYLFDINSKYALIVLLLAFCLLILSYKFRIKSIAFIIASISIGLWLVSQINWKTNINPNFILRDFPAVIKGKIVKIIKEDENYIKLLVEGTVDAKHLPQINNTKAILTIVNHRQENLLLKQGALISASGIAKFPDKAVLATDFDEQQYCISNDAQWLIRAKSKNVAIESEPSMFENILSNSTIYIKEKIRKYHNPENAGIIIALTTGDKSEIPQETKKAFSLSGTAHVLAVSGLHVGIFSAIVFLLLSFVKNKWLKFFVFSGIIILFIIFTGYQPSAQRAGLMAITALFVYTSERRTELLNLLCWVVLLLIILSPQLILSPGFQMSVASIGGIALLYTPIKEKISKVFKRDNVILSYIISSLAITISASVAVSPIVAYYFNVFSIISPIANIIIIPAITLSMIFAFIELVLSMFVPFLASFYASAADVFVTIAKTTSEVSASIPYFYIANKTSFLISILISLLIIYLITANSKKLLIFRLVFGLIILTASILIIQPKENKKIEIIPRKQLTAVIIPSKSDGSFVLLADRKPSQFPYNDYGLSQYIVSLDTPLTIGYTGNASIAIVDKIKKIKKVNFVHIPLEIQNKIADLVKFKEKLPKIINY